MKKAHWQRLEEVRMGMQYDVLQDPTKRVVAVRWAKRLAKKNWPAKSSSCFAFFVAADKIEGVN